MNLLKKNIHPVERIIRVCAGAALTSLAFWGPASPWYLLGLVLVVTGFAGYCPPYALLGISTRPRKESAA